MKNRRNLKTPYHPLRKVFTVHDDTLQLQSPLLWLVRLRTGLHLRLDEPEILYKLKTAVLTTSKTASRIKENFDIAALPEKAIDEINKISTRIRFNTVVETGVPGFIARTN